MTEENKTARDVAWRMLDIVMSLALLAAVTVMGFNTRTLIVHGERLTAIESNQFSASDGLDVWQEIAKVRGEIALLPQLAPPEWFSLKVDRIGSMVDKNDARIEVMFDQLQKRLTKIETQMEIK